jgi:cell division protein FtsA
MVGLTDQLHSPAYSTSVGLLYWALMMSETAPNASRGSRRKGGIDFSEILRTWLKRLLP